MDPYSPPIQLAEFLLTFARVERATLHPDGKRRETDADHTVMLGVVAASLASWWPALHLNPARICELALVHDLAEGICGDTDTSMITAADRSAKELREAAARAEIARRFGAFFPWIVDTMHAYEAQVEPEARWVYVVDKLVPRLTQRLNFGAQFNGQRALCDVLAAQRRQEARLAVAYPEFADSILVLLSVVSAR